LNAQLSSAAPVWRQLFRHAESSALKEFFVPEKLHNRSLCSLAETAATDLDCGFYQNRHWFFPTALEMSANIFDVVWLFRVLFHIF
jgi:hypothetical protein